MKYLIYFLICCSVTTHLEAQIYNKYNTKELKEGLWIEEEDSLKCIGFYEMGKRNGNWSFYKGNHIQKVLSYSNDTLNGYSIRFNDNGTLYKKFYYRNGKLNGIAEFYSKKGDLLAKYEYLNNTILTVILYVIDKETPPRSHDYTPSL